MRVCKSSCVYVNVSVIKRYTDQV